MVAMPIAFCPIRFIRNYNERPGERITRRQSVYVLSLFSHRLDNNLPIRRNRNQRSHKLHILYRLGPIHGPIYRNRGTGSNYDYGDFCIFPSSVENFPT
jgi:hypothetical protein